MHFLVSVLVFTIVYVGLLHTRVNRWAVIVVAVAISNVGHLAVGTQTTIGLVIEFVVLFLITVVGFAKRNIDSTVDGIAHAESDPTTLRADGVAVANHLESLGFEAAVDGWQHFPRLGWDGLAMRRGATNTFIVSGDRGPMFELATFLDDGHTIATVAKSTLAVAPEVLRQCFPSAPLDQLLVEHERSVEWAHGLGRTPEVLALDTLMTRMLETEHRGAPHARRGAGGAVLRELRKQHLDVGSIIGRDDAVEALRRP